MTADDREKPNDRPGVTPGRPKQWFAGGSAKSHVLYVSPEWAHERGRSFDAGSLVRELVDCGVDCIELYAKDHHGNLYYPSGLAADYGRDVVGETLEACRQEGVRFIAYVSVAFDERSVALHPDWLTVDALGRPRVTGPFRWLCLRSGYRDLVLGQIEELVTGYDIDGLWLDIVPIAWPGPYSTTASEGARVWMLHDIVPCYCHACRDQHMLETGDPIPLEPDPDEELAIFRFGIGGVRTLIDASRAILVRHRPSALAHLQRIRRPRRRGRLR